MMEANRAFDNVEKWLPTRDEVSGAYDIPVIRPVFDLPRLDSWVRFCSALQQPPTHSTGVEFFQQDYQFQRVWLQPDRYLALLGKAGAVLSPDFSLYTDMPRAMQINAHYRKHWCAAYWQRHGITVIPTIGWSDEASVAWSFDGEPVGSVVAVSSIGTQRQGSEARRLFRYGYDAMLERLQPETVLFWGSIPAGCKGNICPVERYYKYDKNRRSRDDQA